MFRIANQFERVQSINYLNICKPLSKRDRTLLALIELRNQDSGIKK